jgi:hypothetical protein
MVSRFLRGLFFLGTLAATSVTPTVFAGSIPPTDGAIHAVFRADYPAFGADYNGKDFVAVTKIQSPNPLCPWPM